MKKSAFYITAAIVLVSAAILIPRLLHSAKTETAGHQLSKTTAAFDKTILDVGDVKQFSPIHGCYILRNTGGNGLLIENIKTNCFCTTAFFDKGLIKAKDSTLVTIRYDSTRIGIFQSSGIVTSNGTAEPVLLILRGNVMAQ
jgi:hypothetical protein